MTALDKLSKRELMIMEKLLAVREARLNFALDHHRNTRGERMNLLEYPHIRDVYRSVSPHIVLQGSVQSMKSEFAIVDHFASAFCGLSVFYVLPKYEMRTTYVQNRVNRCVEQVDEYKRIIGSGFFDNVAMKSFGDGVVKYVGSNVLADFKEFPADMIVVEEVDECDADNVEYALDRLRASPYQFKRYLGNPKETGSGIHKFFLESDQREWTVPCLSCGKFSELDWFTTVVEDVRDADDNIVTYELRDREWEEGCGRDIRIVCPHCGGVLERASDRGIWVPKEPQKSVEGYHISMLCSPINSVSGMWNQFRKAVDDPLRMQQFYNSYLGLPFAGSGYRVTEALLHKCVDPDYSFQIEGNVAHVPGDMDIGPCSMGVDVGGVFDVRISRTDERGRRKAVFIGKVRSIDDLYNLSLRYNVEVCVIDSMPETLLVQEFQTSAPCDVWLCRYGTTEGSDTRLRYDSANMHINIDRTNAMDRTFSRMKAARVILPHNYAAILKGEFASEMCGPVRKTTEDAKGNTKYEWSKCKDHQRHADVYDDLAWTLMQDVMIESVYSG